MFLAALQQVDKFYGEQTVLEEATLELRSASRTALIGRNGAGKSTVLNLLSGRIEPDGGNVFVREGVTLAKLEQDPHFDPNATILEVSKKAFEDLDVLEKRLEKLEVEGLDKPEVFDKWERLHEVFERRGGYERRSRRDMVLHALGFRGREDQTARSLSGGEKTRLGLAQLLMAQPDVLLLDEPTNHLDIAMRGWLEGYLSRYPGAVLIVSHDREMLDRACSSMAEIARGTLRSYTGTPSAYRAYREEQLKIEAATRKNQQQEHERLEAAATRMKKWAGQNEKLHRRAKAMFRRLERYEDTMLDEAEQVQGATRFQFESGASGEVVLQAQHLSKAFGDKQLFEDVGFTLRQGERVALVGPNGAGKTTFLKTVLGDLPSDDPQALLRYGARVRVGYYDQELRGVDPDSTLIEEMIRLVGDVEAHNLLGRFMFPYAAQYKLIKDLSGGERARLALLKLTLGENNFLVLDEPTNHLDVEMIEALTDALNAFEGTLLVISHDRRFIRETTNLVWELDEGLTMYEGDWDYYQFKREEREKGQEEREKKDAASTSQTSAEPSKKIPSKWQLERDLERVEEEVAGLEEELKKVTEELMDTQNLDSGEIVDLGIKHAEIEKALGEKLAEWAEVSEWLEAKV